MNMKTIKITLQGRDIPCTIFVNEICYVYGKEGSHCGIMTTSGHLLNAEESHEEVLAMVEKAQQ